MKQKQRVILLGTCLVFSIGFSISSFSKYTAYFSSVSDIRKTALEIETISQTNRDLYEEFEKVRGDDVPKNLKEVLEFLEKYENIQINEIHSFNMEGGGIKIVDTITDTSSEVVCDGFEIILTVDDLNTFISFLDKGKLSYHSADFLFSSNKAVLRIRTGGGVSEQVNN
mgnify:CR=1